MTKSLLREPKRKKIGGSPSQARSRTQEKGLAKKLGGTLTPRSGAGVVKGDIQLPKLARIEAKTTVGKSYAVNASEFLRLQQSLPPDEVPAMVVEFMNPNNKPLLELTIMPSWVLYHLLELAKGKDE